VAAGVARLGQRAAMLGKVGPGSLGSLLIETLARAGVDTHGIMRSQVDPTALAVVSLNSGGESDFMLYRDGCADSRYGPDEVALDIVRACRVLHVGSLSLASPLSAQAQRLAVNTARDAGALISADVNFRPAIWRNLEAMYATGREAIAGADIVKVNAEELAALASATDTATAVRGLWHSNLKLFAVTHGARGAELFTPRCHVNVAGFPVKVADTVGCGDAFMAALLTGLLQNGPATLGEAELHDIGRTACAAGAVMARVVGAMEHMPRQQDIAALIADMA
jgi:fructokinase